MRQHLKDNLFGWMIICLVVIGLMIPAVADAYNTPVSSPKIFTFTCGVAKKQFFVVKAKAAAESDRLAGYSPAAWKVWNASATPVFIGLNNAAGANVDYDVDTGEHGWPICVDATGLTCPEFVSIVDGNLSDWACIAGGNVDLKFMAVAK